MDRREAVRILSLLTGGLLSASTLSALLDGCSNNLQAGKGTRFTEEERNMISGMVDVIIPRTKVPGASDAGVPSFVIMMIQECYPLKSQDEFHKGLINFDLICKKKFDAHFLKMPPEKQVKSVQYLDSRVLGKRDKIQNMDNDTVSFYHNLKGLTVLGYYSSKPGATEALRYLQVPGHYDGCVPYHRGDKEWAT